MAVGICSAVYPCDRDGTVATPPLPPTSVAAISISFAIDTSVPTPPQDQLDLKSDIERTLHALQRLYPDPADEPKFRPHYVQLLTLAQLGLAGPNAAPGIAKRALEGLTADLIDSEGAAVKNGHMQRLGKWAILLALPCLLFYAILRLDTESGFVRTLKALDVDPIMLSSFMMLWVGCFLGVVISYGSRTTTMNLNDLINTDADRLLPQLRLVFAGTLTMVLGVFLVLGVMELKIGSMSTEHIGSNPMLAFLIGALCGISELVLPGTVTKKASDLLGLK